MDPISIALGLAQFVPGVIRWVTGDDKSQAADAADKVIGVAKRVTGKDSGDEALAAVKADPALALQLQQAWMSHEVALWQEETRRLSEVNATMRAEAGSEKWWVSGWRPFWGFVSALAFAVVAVLVCMLAYRAVIGGHPDALATVPNLTSAMAMLFGIPGAILGVASWHRGMEKRIKAGAGND